MYLDFFNISFTNYNYYFGPFFKVRKRIQNVPLSLSLSLSIYIYIYFKKRNILIVILIIFFPPKGSHKTIKALCKIFEGGGVLSLNLLSSLSLEPPGLMIYHIWKIDNVEMHGQLNKRAKMPQFSFFCKYLWY